MAKIINGRELFEALRAAIAETGSARLAVAFWGAGAVEALGLERDQDIEIVCNLAMGGTNPDEVERLIALGARVYALDTLHAKIGVVGAFGFVGSSNISTNGLAFEGEEAGSWHELNVALTSSETLARLHREIEAWRNDAGAPLEPDDPRLAIARERWERRRFETRMMRAFPGKATTLLGALREEPEWFRQRRAFVVVYPEIGPEEVEEFEANQAEVQRERGGDFECYWDWGGLERDGTLLDFAVGPNGVQYQGIFERRPWMQDFKDGEYQVCRRGHRICGFAEPTRAEAAEWQSIIRDHWRGLDPDEREKGRCVPLYEVAKDWLGI